MTASGCASFGLMERVAVNTEEDANEIGLGPKAGVHVLGTERDGH